MTGWYRVRQQNIRLQDSLGFSSRLQVPTHLAVRPLFFYDRVRRPLVLRVAFQKLLFYRFLRKVFIHD